MKRIVIFAATLVMASGAAHALNKIESVRVEPAGIKAGSSVTITVTGDETQGNNCGLRINYGDGDGLDVKVVDKDQFPRTFTKTYARPGTYTVSAEGKKVTSHFGCIGRARVTLVVDALSTSAPAPTPAPVPVAPPVSAPAASSPPAARTVGAGCPQGYQASYVAPGGTYSCRPMPNAPARTPVCLDGHQASYAAKDGSFQCRPMPKPAPKTQCPPDLVYFENPNGTFGCRKPR